MSNSPTVATTRDIELYKVGMAYLALLEIPFDSHFRALNQDIYARLRDHVAKITGQTAEFVQTQFEEKAYS